MPNAQLKNKKMPTKHDIVVTTLVVYLVFHDFCEINKRDRTL